MSQENQFEVNHSYLTNSAENRWWENNSWVWFMPQFRNLNEMIRGDKVEMPLKMHEDNGGAGVAAKLSVVFGACLVAFAWMANDV